jgi:hypothetical protein
MHLFNHSTCLLAIILLSTGKAISKERVVDIVSDGNESLACEQPVFFSSEFLGAFEAPKNPEILVDFEEKMQNSTMSRNFMKFRFLVNFGVLNKNPASKRGGRPPFVRYPPPKLQFSHVNSHRRVVTTY